VPGGVHVDVAALSSNSCVPTYSCPVFEPYFQQTPMHSAVCNKPKLECDIFLLCCAVLCCAVVDRVPVTC
jgi:hypothetical protein